MRDAGGRPREERAFFFLKPEDAGHPERPSASDPPLYVLDTWLGDDQAGLHDLGLTADKSLVVSQRALDQFVQHSIRHATLAQYAPNPTAPP